MKMKKRKRAHVRCQCQTRFCLVCLCLFYELHQAVRVCVFASLVCDWWLLLFCLELPSLDTHIRPLILRQTALVSSLIFYFAVFQHFLLDPFFGLIFCSPLAICDRRSQPTSTQTNNSNGHGFYLTRQPWCVKG